MENIPTIESTNIICVNLCSHLHEKEQAIFIAGFQEAIKYLHTLEVECTNCDWIGKENELVTWPDYKPGHFIDVCPICNCICNVL